MPRTYPNTIEPSTSKRGSPRAIHRLGVLTVLILGCTLPGPLTAGEARVLEARAERAAQGYHFHVTIRHADIGWDHYANAWEVVSNDGATVYGKRTLYHPHVNEQPFTRSLGPIGIPDGVLSVSIRAYDSVHGASSELFPVGLPDR
ncbi:MAG: hypothetical protein ACPGUC_09785 [Gammaproteobacteria bacterium]